MLDQEEVLKAISLEEKALEDFKRRKNSLPQPHTSSGKISAGKLKVSHKYATSIFHFRNFRLE